MLFLSQEVFQIAFGHPTLHSATRLLPAFGSCCSFESQIRIHLISGRKFAKSRKNAQDLIFCVRSDACVKISYTSAGSVTWRMNFKMSMRRLQTSKKYANELLAVIFTATFTENALLTSDWIYPSLSGPD